MVSAASFSVNFPLSQIRSKSSPPVANSVTRYHLSCSCEQRLRSWSNISYLGLKPLLKLDDMWMFHSLQHIHLIIDHLLISSHILLQDDLDSAFAVWSIGFADNTICSGTQCSPEAIFRSSRSTLVFSWQVRRSCNGQGKRTFYRMFRADHQAGASSRRLFT
jgi:hypothetical protein